MRPTSEVAAPVLSGETYDAGTVLAGRYRVVRALGEGGMGQVYACEHVEVGRKVAVKVLQPWLAKHPVGERLRTEARAASAAGHPNIVDVFDAGTLDDGRPFIAMEFLDGQTLHEAVQGAGALPLARAAVVGAEIARALEAAHGAGIIHRDLKPENVMLVERGRDRVVKVVDFGIAFDVAESERRTNAGVAVGTPHYMAPEQALGAPGTATLDIYALGVILFEMVTGEIPFDGPNAVDLLEAKLSSVAPRLETLRDDVPAWYADLVAECLEREGSCRPASAAEVAERLERGRRTDVRAVADTVTRDFPPMRPTPTRRLWLLGGVAVLVAALGVGVWMSRPKPSVGEPALGQISIPVLPPPASLVAPEPSEQPVAMLEPRAEPTPQAKRAPVEKPDSKPRPLPRVSADVQAADEPAPPKVVRPVPECAGVEKRARQARSKHLWEPVLEEVTKKNCWSSGSERKKLHVLALKELGRFASCAKMARGSQDSDVRSWQTLCEKRSNR